MPIEFMWRVEPLILLSTVTGELTADELEGWLRDFMHILDTSPDAVHTILDLRPMTRVTTNILKMPHVFEMLRHPHVGWTAIIGTTPLVSFWIKMLGRTTRFRFKLFPDIEEATEFLLALIRIANEYSEI